ncbi:DUF3769 domain-containing protein [Phormidium pseudopriestleyi FRX01]|uniref:DUF3769 domain-containing protein n=1 Tax=Phormidium pseudopriestleyi FRX01 TaxID=1759528 RepID=A0ABS3FMM0_9CYAN|nr:DUF3769 domain-containing protein [Phormidium pseudopriestleyi]MBO0348152.1 DUF3769 domain-containing protein [Phormidium pseudopriestleyi FRX01]
MPYPVLPPPPPAIVTPVSPCLFTSSAIAPSVDDSATDLSGQIHPTPPETLVTEPDYGVSSAALLGPPLEISSPLKRVEPPVSVAAKELEQSETPITEPSAKQLPDLESPTEKNPETEAIETLSIGLRWTLRNAAALQETASPGESASVSETEPQTRDLYPEEVETAELPVTRAQETDPEAGERVAEVPATSGENRTPPTIAPADTVELKADRQEFDNERQIVTGEGNARMRGRGAAIDGERLQINLESQVAIAEGEAVYVKGQQVLQGDRIEYDLVQNRGGIDGAKGDIFTPTTADDFSPGLPTDVSATALQQQDIMDRLRAGEPPRRITPAGGITFGGGRGSLPTTGGTIDRFRFEADRLNFNDLGWEGTNVRMTNDPFSPPELELRSPRATFRPISPLQDEIFAKNPRLVFDDRISIPLLRERVILDRSDQDPSLIRFGYDQEDRGGVYAETTVIPLGGSGPVQINLIPQYYIQRTLLDGIGKPSRLFGLKARLGANPTPTTSIVGEARFTDFDFNDEEENLRGTLRVRQMVGTHAVSGEYNYRDRLFNGSLGYQTVHQNVGLVVTSPAISLGGTGINLSYQASAQYIDADSDRPQLLPLVRDNNRIDSSRFQASAAVSRGFLLWQGKALPRTRTEGLRYTPAPVVPYVRLFGGLTGVASIYGSDDTQNALTGSIGIQGQFGHFSRRWLDYTGFNVSLSRIWKDGESPFLFDRIADSKVLTAGVTQQVYGPFRVGVQSSFNLDTGERISTDLSMEYSRRTYGVNLRFSPERQVGSLSLQLNNFSWFGSGNRFSPVGDR